MDSAGIPIELAEHVLKICEEHGIVSADGAVDLDLKIEEIAEVLEYQIRSPNRELFEGHKDRIHQSIMRSRYTNLHGLLQNHVAEKTYLGIVKNKILVDVQGEDVSSLC